MTTLHERAAHDFLLEQMADARAVAVLSTWAGRLLEDESRQADFDLYGQTPTRFGRWPMEQMCCAVAAHSHVAAGNFACYPLRVASGPGPDADRDSNAALLAGLRDPFHAEVHPSQHGGDQDGTLRWDRPIVAVRSTGFALLDPLHGEEPLMKPCVLDPGTAPLEIGYTKPSRTLAHLVTEGSVARWPYGSNVMTLIVNISGPRRTL